MKTLKVLSSALVISGIALWLISGHFVGIASGASLVARTSNAAGVEVVVTPKIVVSNVAAWEFEITMNTHTTALSVDLAQTAVLIDDTGRRYAPLAWQGDAPGGHHRKGILRFPLPPGKPRSIELKIKGIGADNERVFRWELN